MRQQSLQDLQSYSINEEVESDENDDIFKQNGKNGLVLNNGLYKS